MHNRIYFVSRTIRESEDISREMIRKMFANFISFNDKKLD